MKDTDKPNVFALFRAAFTTQGGRPASFQNKPILQAPCRSAEIEVYAQKKARRETNTV